MIDRIQAEREARAYVARGEWEKAISLYRELLENKGEDPNIYNLIGDVYAKMDDLADAIPEYISAIDLYEAEGLFENGIAVCRKIMRLDPEMEETYFNLAVFYAEIGLLNEAKDSLTNYLERSRDKKKIEKNPQKYKKLIMLLSSDERLKPDIKELYTKVGQREKELDGIFGIAPLEPEKKVQEEEVPAKEIPVAEISTPSPKEETPVTETAPQPRFEEKVPEEIAKPRFVEPETRPEMERVGKPSFVPTAEGKEMQVLLHAIEEIKASNSSEIKKDHYNLAMEYKKLGFYDVAIKEFQLSTATGSQRLKSLREVGYCFLEKGQTKLAVNAFKRAIEEGGKKSEDYIPLKYGMGRAYELLGDKKSAIDSFEEVCLHNIDYRDVQERLKKLKG